MTVQAGDVRSTLLDRIRAGAVIPDTEFDRLAGATFEHQWEYNAPYRAFCARRGVSPDMISDWLEIPAVPTDAFKSAALVCGDPAEATIVFRTSGTTQGAERRGEHYLRDLALYDAALRAGFAAALLPDGARLPMLSLVPPVEALPDSSLSYMIRAVIADFGAPGSGYYADEQGINTLRLNAALRDAEAAGRAVCLLGTSIAFLHWLDVLRADGTRFRLPHGSRIMDTGGSKGRSREVSRDEMLNTFRELLGVEPEWCVNEYGMTEMGSQFYDVTAGKIAPRAYTPPPWVRTRAMDPETLRLLPDGKLGVLRHWDLANLDSVLALQTADLGVVENGRFRLLGRARGAEARGCSLAMDELLHALGAGMQRLPQ